MYTGYTRVKLVI